MSSKKQDVIRKKEFGFKRFLNSWKDSFDGLLYAYTHEQSLFIHGIASIIVIIMGFILKLSFSEWAIVFTTLVVVLAVELLNTAIETTIDLITLEYHPLARIAKDSASAAAFVSALAAVIICGFIMIPKIMVLFA